MTTTAFLVINGRGYEFKPGERRETSDFVAVFQSDEAGIWRLRVTPRRPVVLNLAEARLPLAYAPTDQLFCNGFQSWSESRWFSVQEHIRPLRKIARPLMQYYGDEHIPGIRRGPGWLHSWSWTCRQTAPREHIQCWASLGEAEAFTLFIHDLRSGQLLIRRDAHSLSLSDTFDALVWLSMEGAEAECFDRWFAAMKLPPPPTPTRSGWTSWYHYYANIDAPTLTANLTAARDHALRPEVFQIDDGWQQAVGDWLEVKPGFPSGMAPLAQQIREQGMIPGLWLAPFVADRRAQLIRRHPDWLLKGRRGKPIFAGYSPPWGGRFYALDFSHPGVHEYLADVFRTLKNEWGYGLFKLDFLYAACLAPPPGQTRGGQMHQALRALRQWAGDAWLLGCGLPLASGFGLLDYCRIGADIHLHWEHELLRGLRNRERVSTLLALRSVLGRWALDGRAWRNDPDVFLLRQENLRLSDTQKELVLRVNTLLGGLLFTSDPLHRANPEAERQLQWLHRWKNVQILGVECLETDIFTIRTSRGAFGVNLTGEMRRGYPPYSCMELTSSTGY